MQKFCRFEAQTRSLQRRTGSFYRQGATMLGKGLPHFAKGEVVKGFGRGSKELGCPTANFPVEVVNGLPTDIDTGIYYGFASVDKGDVHKMVLSIGWNPFYQNKVKSMETHILHEYDSDFLW
ncbi:hypothetical protein NQ318_000934 [Aromia moschata]|uniref:riboflavin kinase n=1 Tax=Aromia moschata TaxID=1265417 RepID=A0AAV8ZG38_9CUCU|nr:hypothetical protein NQ318_000934 [Aromia moschata]